MSKSIEDKRKHPRVKTNLDVNISRGILGNSVDLSEGGLSFTSEEIVSSPTISLQVRFPGKKKELKTKVKLAWKRSLDEGKSAYGVEFIGLKEKEKAVLREELIKAQLSELLKGIELPESRKLISDFFLNDVLNYVSEMIKLTQRLSKEKRYSDELGRKLTLLNNQILLKGYQLENRLSDKKNMEKVKDNFRQMVGVWAYKSVIVKRAFEKPRGYPGDYRMLEIVYDNKPISPSNDVGLYFDNNFLQSPYAAAVRIRKDRLRDLLQRFIHEAQLSKINILDIACGSCREILELFPGITTSKKIVFNCLDWDEEALQFSNDTLSYKRPKNVELKFIKEDVMNIVRNKASVQTYGKQDLIYSIGLIDYLPDRILKKLISALFALLQKGGWLVLTHKNKEKTFPPLPPDWFCNWKFVPRSRDEVIKLFSDCGFSDCLLPVVSDDFEYIYYFTLIKK